MLFLLTPLREGRRGWYACPVLHCHFYSRPCGRGDSLTAKRWRGCCLFLLTPLREGRLVLFYGVRRVDDFYSRPCGRGDTICWPQTAQLNISTHAPAGGATSCSTGATKSGKFLLTPLREGRRHTEPESAGRDYFYSRPCGRGDPVRQPEGGAAVYFYSRPCGRGDIPSIRLDRFAIISTHAPAGGAT